MFSSTFVRTKLCSIYTNCKYFQIMPPYEPVLMKLYTNAVYDLRSCMREECSGLIYFKIVSSAGCRYPFVI